MPKLYKGKFNKYLKYQLTFALVFFLAISKVYAQCPPNIDFEEGTFRGWQCYSGNFFGTINPNPTVPTVGRHDMLSNPPGNGRDFYGNFTKNCPNGSGHSIKIGNEITGHSSDKVSYTFTIPAGRNIYNLIYQYAVVLNDANNSSHPPNLQPRLVIEVKNITDGMPLPCPLDPIVVNGSLPGFQDSQHPGSGGTVVRFKNWAAASIKLDGNAGKTIEVSFTVTGCGLQSGSHFGYAYIDINAQCSSAFTGATFCPDDTAVNVTAPYGYQTYNWYNNNFSQLLGTGQTLTLNPPPLAGDSVFVELIPYNGYGCQDTLSAKLWDTLSIRANAGADVETCDNNPVQIGSPPEPGRVYKWLPATGLSNPDIANPIATPSATTTYTLTVTNSGGGCATQDAVAVTVDVLSDSIQQTGPSSYCTASGQSVTLRVLPHDSIQWYKDGAAIIGAQQTQFNVLQTGAYYAMVFSPAGCSRTTAVKQIDIWESPVSGFNTPIATQCFTNNQFVFTNASTLTTGILQYAWDFGDGTTATTRNAAHNYMLDSTYTVKLLITAPGGCADSTKINVVVNPSPNAAFTIDTPEQCFKNNQFNFTNSSTVRKGLLNYIWNFGDSNFANTNNTTHGYTIPDTFNVRLTATAISGGCADDSIMQVVVHPSPVASFIFNSNPQCFPGHQFVMANNSSIYSGTVQYAWSFGDGITDTAANPIHKYGTYGKYTVKLNIDAAGGCKDSLAKPIEIFAVPDADFSVQSVCENLRIPVINRTTNNSNSTVNYFWDFGNGHLDNVYTPVYTYTTPGSYALTLRVSTAQCPVSFNSITKSVVIERLIPGITYPEKDAAYNYNEQLQARRIGTIATWNPATNLNNRFSYAPIFRGLTPQLYTIELKTAAGCITTDTQLVKTHKKIDIYVPNGFTPGNDNLNERLRPVLVGFSKVNYFRIYNRWGKLLYSSASEQPGWDGKFNGTPVSMQTVVWMIEAVDVDGAVHQKQGSTVVIR